MRRYIQGRRIRSPISLFILPMIDVIFLLLLFFVVVTSFEASAKIKVEVPKPDQSQARRDESGKQVVINCEVANPGAPETGGALYRIAADAPEPLILISSRLAAAKLANPQLSVVIRADRRLAYAFVRPVMKVVADHGIESMNVSALRDVEK